MSDGTGPGKVYDFGFRHRRSIPSATGDSPWADSGSKTAQRRNSLPTPWPWASTGPNANAIGAAEYYSNLNNSTGSDWIGHSRSRFWNLDFFNCAQLVNVSCMGHCLQPPPPAHSNRPLTHPPPHTHPSLLTWSFVLFLLFVWSIFNIFQNFINSLSKFPARLKLL